MKVLPVIRGKEITSQPGEHRWHHSADSAACHGPECPIGQGRHVSTARAPSASLQRPRSQAVPPSRKGSHDDLMMEIHVDIHNFSIVIIVFAYVVVCDCNCLRVIIRVIGCRFVAHGVTSAISNSNSTLWHERYRDFILTPIRSFCEQKLRQRQRLQLVVIKIGSFRKK